MKTTQYRGFSLVELMVAIVVGMIAVVFVTRTMVSFESARRGTTGGSDSLQNAMEAMFSIESDIGQGGWGVNNPQIFGCDANTRFSDLQGFALDAIPAAAPGASVRPLAPVMINFSAAVGAPDTISTYSGSSVTGTGSYPLSQAAAAGAQTITLLDANGFGFNANDVLVIAEADPSQSLVGPCTIVEAAAVPIPTVIGGATVVNVNLAGSRFTPAAGVPVAIPTNSLNPVPTRVYNLGPQTGLAFHTWSVANGRLMLRSTELAGSSTAAQTVVSNVVSIKALYGFDNVWATTGPQLRLWSRSMIDADGSGIAGDMYDYQRILAVRLAVVARSKEAEKPDSSGNCTATTAQPVVFRTEEPAGVPTIPIAVDVAVPGDTMPWQCYRYKVFETVVPLRNSGWK
ncbi:MAG: PilW family protein [Burkholderiales bacterium]|nr:PilW family protein [Burkholderiales bacterium]